MSKPLRAALTLLALAAALTAAGAGGVRAADPTLGLAVETPLILSVDRALTVESRSTLTQRVTVTPAGGFTTDPAELVLAPAQRATFAVLGDGADGTRLLVTFTDAATAAPGATRGVGTIESLILHQPPAGPWLWAALVLGALVLLLLLVLRLRRRRRA